MTSNQDCTASPVETSRCIIEAILADLSETYKPAGGGGISSIKRDATWVFTVSIAQEERVDLVTYTVEMNGDKVRITNRETGTKSR